MDTALVGKHFGFGGGAPLLQAVRLFFHMSALKTVSNLNSVQKQDLPSSASSVEKPLRHHRKYLFGLNG
jgi:hypothetical protein